METNLIRSLIASYFGIVRQTIQDLVPKAIMHLLVSILSPTAIRLSDRCVGEGLTLYRHNSDQQVNFSRDAIQQRLVTSLYKPDLFEELLYEDEALVTERTRVKALLDAYKEAFRVLSEVSLKSA
jgi:dynamin 1-like protein